KSFPILGRDIRPPTVAQDWLPSLVQQGLAILVELGPAVVAMPQSANVLDVAQLTGLDDLQRMRVKQAVVALVANRQDSIRCVGDLMAEYRRRPRTPGNPGCARRQGRRLHRRRRSDRP